MPFVHCTEIFLDTIQDPYTDGECFVTDLSDFDRFTNSTQHSMGKKCYDILVHRNIEKQSMLSFLHYSYSNI